MEEHLRLEHSYRNGSLRAEALLALCSEAILAKKAVALFVQSTPDFRRCIWCFSSTRLISVRIEAKLMFCEYSFICFVVLSHDVE